jgi:hypothetical protein
MRSRYGREIKPPKVHRVQTKLTAKSTTIEEFVGYFEEDKTDFLNNLILLARKSSTNADTLYLHESIKAPDSKTFKETMLEEINQRIKKKNWKPILKTD